MTKQLSVEVAQFTRSECQRESADADKRIKDKKYR